MYRQGELYVITVTVTQHANGMQNRVSRERQARYLARPSPEHEREKPRSSQPRGLCSDHLGLHVNMYIYIKLKAGAIQMGIA